MHITFELASEPVVEAFGDPLAFLSFEVYPVLDSVDVLQGCAAL